MHDLDLILHKIPSREITVIPVSDVHLGAIEHCQREWENFCNIVRDTPDTYITLGGDLINNSIRSSVANPFDEIMRPREQKKRMVEYLTPIRDRILCAVSGNHEARSAKETDTDITYDIMAKLDLEDIYRENAAFIKLSLGSRSSGSDRSYVSYILCVTHGTGGGIYTGAAVNRNERFSHMIEGVDCFFIGHTHKGTVSRPTKLVVDSNSNKIYTRSITVVSSESWLNYGGYALKKMLLPSEVANPQRVIFKGRYDNKKIEVVW